MLLEVAKSCHKIALMSFNVEAMPIFISLVFAPLDYLHIVFLASSNLKSVETQC